MYFSDVEKTGYWFHWKAKIDMWHPLWLYPKSEQVAMRLILSGRVTFDPKPPQANWSVFNCENFWLDELFHPDLTNGWLGVKFKTHWPASKGRFIINQPVAVFRRFSEGAKGGALKLADCFRTVLITVVYFLCHFCESVCLFNVMRATSILCGVFCVVFFLGRGVNVHLFDQ